MNYSQQILITGGAGFIGSHFCDNLLKKGFSIICLDNLLTGRKENIIHLFKNKNFKFIRQDVTNPSLNLWRTFPGKLDAICHLASPAAPKDYLKFPLETLKAGSLGTLNLLELARKKRAIFLFASTSEIYGDPKVSPQKETYWGNVNSIGPRSCYSSDTEILTKSGWKFFYKLNKNDYILTLSKDHKIEYHQPQEIIKEEYKGQLIRFKNYQCDLLVTPNHKMYVKKRNNREFKFIEAFKSINWSRTHMLKVANYENKNIKYFFFPENVDRKNSKTPFVKKVKMDDWLEFFGYYITEGCVSIQRRRRIINNKKYISYNYRVLIAQDKHKNTQNYNRIKSCLERLPFNFVNSYDHQFCITNKQLANYLIRFGKSDEKYIPRELLNISKRQLKILFEAMMLGDGNKEGNKYYSSSFRLISDFQELLLRIGYAGNIAIHDKGKSKPLYRIHILNRFNNKYRTPTYSNRCIQNYNGFVYCVNVPNHIIYVRRNGKAVFCGNCYDEAKRFSEALVMAFYRKYNLSVKIARIFNTYGPKMKRDDGRVVPAFIGQTLKNEPLTIFGRGDQTRSFCYVSDLVEGLYRLLKSKEIGPINLGNPREMKVFDLAKLIIKMTGAKSKIIYKPLPVDDPKCRCPEIKRAKELLNWQPKVNLEQGLKKTINWFKTA